LRTIEPDTLFGILWLVYLLIAVVLITAILASFLDD
jgi:hypothetical protein